MPSAKPFIILPKHFAPKKVQNVQESENATKKGDKHQKKGKKQFEKQQPSVKEVKPWYQEKTLQAPQGSLLVKSGDSWYSQYKGVFSKESPSADSPHLLLSDQLSQMSEKIEVLYREQHSFYVSQLSVTGGGVSDKNWLNSVIQAGTWSDKIAALSLKVQESPFYNLEALDLLIGIALNKDIRTAGMAVEALKDLFLNSLLPNDRPLYNFAHLPFTKPEFTVKHALLGWYEKELRLRYIRVLQVVEKSLKANLMYFRRAALTTVYDLLLAKPEQESKLLSMIVNKIGDSDGKIVSKAQELLKELLKKHTAMKAVIVYEVRVFIQRQLSKIPVLFHAITFLNQIQVHASEVKAAVLLAECHLSLFELALQAKEKGSRLLSALLTGINRVFPKITVLGDLVKYVDTIFRLVHTARSKAASTQALILLSHLVFDASNGKKIESGGKAQIANRFYQTLYNKLMTDQACVSAYLLYSLCVSI
ncbi:hypothetical protein EON65_28500 [archaeon]|nr:MAG: hypothetical protein EON65_28500 [archaeon]